MTIRDASLHRQLIQLTDKYLIFAIGLYSFVIGRQTWNVQSKNWETLSRLALLESGSWTEPKRKTIPPKRKKRQKSSPYNCPSVDYCLCQVSTCTRSKGFCSVLQKDELTNRAVFHKTSIVDCFVLAYDELGYQNCSFYFSSIIIYSDRAHNMTYKSTCQFPFSFYPDQCSVIDIL